MRDLPKGPSPPQRESGDSDGKVLRLHCPFCSAEYPLWFRKEADDDETLSPTEWERWLDARCEDCGKTPRQHITTP